VPNFHGTPIPRGNDAEIKLLGHTLGTIPLGARPDAAGRAYLSATAIMCPSCTGALWRARSLLPGVDILDRMPLPVEGAAGALDTLLPTPDRNAPTPATPAVELNIHF
jgi:hypothetical protein